MRGVHRSRCGAPGRQWPIAERFQTVAGDVEDVVAGGATIAQRFEVILQAGERIRKCVELAAVGDATAIDQFDFGVHAHAVEVLRRL